MFQSLARKATAAARPVKFSGVARVRVSSSANCEPAAPLSTSAKVLGAEAPLHITSTPPMSRLTPSAPSGASTATTGEAPLRGSSRMRRLLEAVARHHQPELLDGDPGARHRRRQPAAMHHDDAVGERQDLVQVLG